MSEYGLGTEALPGACGPSQSEQEDFKLPVGGPRCCCTVPGVPGSSLQTEPSGPLAIQS